jgi:hypothetical protein
MRAMDPIVKEQEQPVAHLTPIVRPIVGIIEAIRGNGSELFCSLVKRNRKAIDHAKRQLDTP